MKLHVEIFFTKITDESVVYFRDFLDISYKSKNPDTYVLKQVEKHAQELRADPANCIVHSTSWRCEHIDLIVLTYIVYSDELILPSDKSQKIPIEELEIATSEDLSKPKPGDAAEKNVVSHGMRHISFLIRNDENYKQKVSKQTKDAFVKIDNMLAGKI